MKSRTYAKAMLTSLATLMLSAILPLAMCLITHVEANATESVVPDSIARFLVQSDYSHLDKYLNKLQRSFEAGEMNAEKSLFETYDTFYHLKPPMQNAEQHLNAWVSSFPQSYAAHLARGNFYIQKGLDARGGAYASETKDKQFKEMAHWFDLGRADLELSITLTKKPFLSHLYLLIAAMRSGPSNAVKDNYYAAIQFAPNSIELRQTYMESLEPRWGGSYEEMISFAAESEKVLGRGAVVNQLKSYILWTQAWGLTTGGNLKHLQESYKLHSEAIALYDKPRYRCSRARLLMKMNRVSEAMADMEVAFHSPIRSPTRSDYCHEATGWIAKRDKNAPGIIDLLDGYLKEEPQDVYLLNQRGWLFQQRGAMEQAYADYKASAAMGDGWATLMQARYVFNGWGGQQIDREAGLLLFRRAAVIGDAEAQNCLVDALRIMGRTNEAEDTQKKYEAERVRNAELSKADEDPIWSVQSILKFFERIF